MQNVMGTAKHSGLWARGDKRGLAGGGGVGGPPGLTRLCDSGHLSQLIIATLPNIFFLYEYCQMRLRSALERRQSGFIKPVQHPLGLQFCWAVVKARALVPHFPLAALTGPSNMTASPCAVRWACKLVGQWQRPAPPPTSVQWMMTGSILES